MLVLLSFAFCGFVSGDCFWALVCAIASKLRVACVIFLENVSPLFESGRRPLSFEGETVGFVLRSDDCWN